MKEHVGEKRSVGDIIVSLAEDSKEKIKIYRYLQCYDPSATSVDLSRCGLDTVPPALQRLPKLQVLNLKRNPHLCNLPEWLAQLKSLRTVHLPDYDACSIRNVPRDIYMNGWKDVQTFLRNVDSGKRVYRKKMMVVGQHNVGKTSLVRALCGQPVQQVEASTDGIQINSKELKLKVKNESVSITLWDFGGQPVYYDTHHFFLTQSSIYIVVWSVPEGMDESKVEYWLDVITAKAGKEAPVVIVGTHLDSIPPEDVDNVEKMVEGEIERLRVRYPVVRGYMCCSCKAKGDMVSLKQYLGTLVISLLANQAKVPQSYLWLEEEATKLGDTMMEESKVPVITWEQFKEIKIKRLNNSSLAATLSQEEFLQAAMLFKSYGTLHYFPEIPALRNVVILRADFLVNLFSHFVTVRSNFVKGGLLKAQVLPHILKDYPDSMHDDLINLCVLFGVLVPAAYSTDYILCSLLPEEAPAAARTLSLSEEDEQGLILFESLLDAEDTRGVKSEKENDEAATQDGSSLPLPKDLDGGGKWTQVKPIANSSTNAIVVDPHAFGVLQADAHVKRFSSVARRFDFSILPPGLFSHFMSRFVGANTRDKFWRHGFILNQPTCRVLCEVLLLSSRVIFHQVFLFRFRCIILAFINPDLGT